MKLVVVMSHEYHYSPGSLGVGARGTDGIGFCSEEGVGGWVVGSGRDQGGRMEVGDFISGFTSDFMLSTEKERRERERL